MVTMYNIKCVICDMRKLFLTYYDYDFPKSGNFNSQNDVLRWCVNNIPSGTCIILIGTSNQTKFLFRELKQFNFYVFCYELADIENVRKTGFQQINVDEILTSVNEIKALLKREPPKSANYALINTSSPQLETKDIKEIKSFIKESFEALNKKQSETNYLVTEIYNRDQETSSNGNSEVIKDLRKELAEYKNDFYQKSMMKLGVNIAIDILERLYTEKNLLKQKENSEEMDRITQIISFCEAKMKKLNVRVKLSSEGDEFDGIRMVSFDDKVATDNSNMKGRVAYSIFPAIYWTLPRVNAPGEDELLIKEETVALYE